ncbi:MAG: putative lipid II flippase FtsW [Actinomycetia bacterium]|nr:putative lipid II flippase FtsW [Actinomycetes bacterium]
MAQTKPTDSSDANPEVDRDSSAVGRWSDRFGGHPASIYYLMFGSTIFLLVVGVLMVWSASAIDGIRDSGSSTALVSKQALFAVVGLAAMFFASRLSTAQLRTLAWPLLGVSVILLVLVLIPGIGVSVNGQRNWIDLGGPFRLQPSEIAKLALVLWGAHVLTRKWRPTTDWPTLLVPLLPAAGAIALLVSMEGDFGNAMILGVITAGLFFAVGAPLRLFVGLGALGVAGLTLAIGAEDYRRERWTSFLESEPDRLDTAWQVTQGTYALGTGGWWGVGLGASREKWGTLPAAHTDFILPVIGEELGLLGTLGVLTLFAILVGSVLRLGQKAPDRFTRLLAAGVGTWLIIQVITNVGAALKMLPITGVTLPMVSYGGSSLLPLLVALGLLLGAARRLHSSTEETAVASEGLTARE